MGCCGKTDKEKLKQIKQQNEEAIKNIQAQPIYQPTQPVVIRKAEYIAPQRPCTCDLPSCKLCRAFRTDPKYQKLWGHEPLLLNQTGMGIGDALSGLIAIKGAQAAFPNRNVTYLVRKDNHKWVELFDGYDSLHNHIPDVGININVGYPVECITKAKVARWERYCNDAGGVIPTLPLLKNKQKLREAQKHYNGVVVLCPFSVYNNRNYSFEGWISVEKLLMKAGYKTVVLHSGHIDRFKSEHVINQTPEVVAGIMLNAYAVVCVDNGMAHLSSLIQETKKTVVLTGPTGADKIFFNPVIEVASDMHCKSCYWQAPYGPNCDKACAALWAINPSTVVEAVKKIAQSKESDIHVHHPDEKANLFTSYDGGSVEVETGEMLQALVRTYKPELVLEAGTYLGVAARLLSQACTKNGFGKVITLEISEQRINEHTRKNLEDLDNVQIICANALEWLQNYNGKPFDLIFLDTEVYSRCDELNLLKEKGLAKGPVFVHDTSRLRSMTMPDAPTYPTDLDALGLVSVENNLSRGWRLFDLSQKRVETPELFFQDNILENIMESDPQPDINSLSRYEVLFSLVKKLKPKTIVEIGVRCGYSAWTMLRAAPEASLLGIDLDGDENEVNTHTGYKGAWKTAVEINRGYKFNLLIADSHKLDRLPDCDLCYIDGDHYEEGVMQDLLLAEKSAKVILLDDYSVDNLGIKSAVTMFMSTRPHLIGELIEGTPNGLYMITKKERVELNVL